MIVASNASPLINLARIGQLDLLQQLYREVQIPDAVRSEVVEEGAGQPGSEEVATAGWIRTHTVRNRALVQALRQELDAGEAEAIALAVELGADWLLMDERLGRDVSRHLGVAVTGLIGVLIEAKRLGVIPAVRPGLDALRDRAGFRIRQALYDRVLRDVSE